MDKNANEKKKHLRTENEQTNCISIGGGKNDGLSATGRFVSVICRFWSGAGSRGGRGWL